VSVVIGKPHLSFGTVEHFCLGVYLAVSRVGIFFTELLAAFEERNRLVSPVRLRLNLNSSDKPLPVGLSASL